MFCCTKNEKHAGEIVTSICLQQKCQSQNNQLCCTVCMQEHPGHTLQSLKQYLPTLLNVQKRYMDLFCTFQKQLKNYFPDFYLQTNSFKESFHATLQRVKEYLQKSTEQTSKVKKALKTIQQTQTYRTDTIQQPHLGGSSIFPSSARLNVPQQMAYSSLRTSESTQKFGFSSKLKHGHLSLSGNNLTVTKTTSNPQKIAILSNFLATSQQYAILFRINRSVKGNILIGACNQKSVIQRQYINCYGVSTGTYLLGQNFDNEHSAICFHNENPNFNRKEIVGWNFKQEQSVVVFLNFQDNLIQFKNKSKDQKFVMPIQNLSEVPNLRFIAILQNQGDQVSIQQV